MMDAAIGAILLAATLAEHARRSMTRADLYHYGAQHFDFHSRQLTLSDAS